MKDFKELEVWKKSIDLVVEVYRLTKLLPDNEKYTLSDQIRRATISIPSIISEGFSRQTTKEYIQFLYIALGSSAKLETQLILTNRLHHTPIDSLIFQILNIRKMLSKLISILKRRLS